MIKERNIIWRRRRERDNGNETGRTEAAGGGGGGGGAKHWGEKRKTSCVKSVFIQNQFRKCIVRKERTRSWASAAENANGTGKKLVLKWIKMIHETEERYSKRVKKETREGERWNVGVRPQVNRLTFSFSFSIQIRFPHSILGRRITPD